MRACCFSQNKADSLQARGADETVPFDLNDTVNYVYSSWLLNSDDSLMHYAIPVNSQ